MANTSILLEMLVFDWSKISMKFVSNYSAKKSSVHPWQNILHCIACKGAQKVATDARIKNEMKRKIGLHGLRMHAFRRNVSFRLVENFIEICFSFI
jgi:hypothetical protein